MVSNKFGSTSGLIYVKTVCKGYQQMSLLVQTYLFQIITYNTIFNHINIRRKQELIEFFSLTSVF